MRLHPDPPPLPGAATGEGTQTGRGQDPFGASGWTAALRGPDKLRGRGSRVKGSLSRMGEGQGEGDQTTAQLIIAVR